MLDLGIVTPHPVDPRFTRIDHPLPQGERGSAQASRPARLMCAEAKEGGLMFEIFGISSQALFGQLLIGLINGSFYALLSLGLAVIFGMLNIINFTHGAQYMMGAFAAYFLLEYAGLGYWWAIIIAPLAVGATGIVIERLFLQGLYK